MKNEISVDERIDQGFETKLKTIGITIVGQYRHIPIGEHDNLHLRFHALEFFVGDAVDRPHVFDQDHGRLSIVFDYFLDREHDNRLVLMPNVRSVCYDRRNVDLKVDSYILDVLVDTLRREGQRVFDNLDCISRMNKFSIQHDKEIAKLKSEKSS